MPSRRENKSGAVISGRRLLRQTAPVVKAVGLRFSNWTRFSYKFLLLSYGSKTFVFVTSVSDMFCAAGYNAHRQRVLKGKTPDLVVAERLTAKPALAKDKPAGRARSCDITLNPAVGPSHGQVAGQIFNP